MALKPIYEVRLSIYRRTTLLFELRTEVNSLTSRLESYLSRRSIQLAHETCESLYDYKLKRSYNNNRIDNTGNCKIVEKGLESYLH